jgi:acetylornithine deacetylase/succinyl-diaminopimelate desuccinylase-like protein
MPPWSVTTTEETELARIAASPLFARITRFFAENVAATTDELVRVVEIPSPPFHEHNRANYILSRFRDFNLTDAHIDDEGNVLGLLGPADGDVIAVAAHLDSVFPEGTNVAVRREGSRLYAPGIADNACGLTGMLAVARCFTELNIVPPKLILFVGTVGEEGPGDLRGVRALFERNPYSQRIQTFVAFDGPGIERITNHALGSRRFEVKFEGPGGHSWANFGIVNPIQALGRFIHGLARYDAPAAPRTAYTVAVVEGGVSVNTIPRLARCEVDLRSVSEVELDRLEAFLHAAARQAREDENHAARASETRIEMTVNPIGRRPSGETAPDAPLVRMAREATRLCGHRSLLDCGSTDSNIPMSRGVPAITIGVGGSCAGCHTLNEWYDPVNRETSLRRAALLLLGLSGISS